MSMADLVMDNPLVSQPQLNKVAQDTIDCIVELKREFTETKAPISDDNQTLHRFCAKLEHLLRAEMKEKTTLLGRRKEYYDYFCDCLSSTKGLNDGIKFVKSTGEYKTSTGRGRAFIRFSLVHQRLADTIQQCVMNGKVTSDWYTTRSVWLNHNQKTTMITALYELNELNFDLLPRGYDLDNAWPSFSRKTHGLTQGTWNPPSRASSYTSIVSLPGQEPLFTRERRDTTSTTVSEAEFEQMNRDLSLSESDRSQMSQRMEELEQENINIAEAITAKEQDLMDREGELAKALERCRILETEMGLKEKMWIEKENRYQTEVSSQSEKMNTLEDKIDQLRDEVVSAEKSFTKREDEYRCQVQEQEKKGVQLEVELKSAQQVTESVREVLKVQEDTVSSLQAKLTCQDAKNEELLNKIENMVLTKDSEVGSQLDAAGKLHAVLDNLKTSEEENVELRTKLSESSTKCESLESNLAQSEQKLKTTLEELEKMKSDSQLKHENFIAKEKETADEIEVMLSELKTLKCNNEQLTAELREKKSAADKLSEEISVLRRQGGELSEQLRDQQEKDSNTRQLLESSESVCKELRQREQQLKQELSDKDQTIGQLRSEMDTMKTCNKESQDECTSLRQQLTERKTGLQTLVSQLSGLLDNNFTDKNKETMISLIPEGDGKQNFTLFITNLGFQKSKLEDMEQKFLGLQKEVSQVKEESSEKGRQLHSQQQELDQLREMNNALENLETDAKSRSEKDASLLQLKDDRIHGLEEQVLEKEDTITQLKSEIFSKTEDIARKNQELAEMTTSAQKVQQELQNSSQFKEQSLSEKCLTAENSLLEEKKISETLSAENTKLSDDLREVNKNVRDSQDQLTQLKEFSTVEKQALAEHHVKEMEEIQLKYEEEKSANMSCSNRLADVEIQLETHKSENSAIISRCETLTRDLQLAQEQLTMAQQEHETLTRDLQLVKEQLTTTQQECEMLTRDLQLAKEQLTVAQHECNDKQKQIEELKQTNLTLVDKSRKVEEEVQLKSECLQENAANNSEKDKVINNLEKIIVELKSEARSKTERLKQLEKECEDLQQNQAAITESRDEDIKKHEAEVKTWKSAVENEKEASVILRAEREEMKSDVEKLKRDKDKLSEEISTLKNTLKEKEDLLLVTKLQVEGDRQAIVNQTEVQEQEIQALKFQLSSQQLQHEQALEKYSEHESDINSLTERSSEQESLIEQLEGEMWSIKQAREEEQRQQKQEVAELKAALETREKEFNMLSTKLVETSTKLADEHNQVAILQHQVEVKVNLEQLLEQSREENSGLKKESSVLKSDLVQLKKKLIRLIKEKDALWQKTDSLVYEQRVHATEKWMVDSEVTNCMGCRIEFSFTTRKHHCRLCGRIFCWNCSNNWIMTTSSNKKTRVCNGCYIKQRDVDGNADSSLVGNDSDEDEGGLTGSLRRRSAVPEDTVSQSSTSQDGVTSSSLDISGLMSGDTDSLASADIRDVATPDSSANGTRCSGDETDDNKEDKHLPDAAKNKDFSSTTDELTSDPGVIPPDDSGKDDPFHVISDEEIVKSLSGSLGSPPPSMDMSVTCNLVITVEDLEKGHVNRDNEVWLKPGRRFAVPIRIDSVGVIICWEFSTQPKDIGFSATYGESEITPSHEAQVLIEPCKCNSHKQAVRGELTAKKQGVYTLMFDNTYSKFTTKKLSYSLYLKKTS